MATPNDSMRSFEDQWAQVFEGAEIAPSGQVWSDLDGILANSDAKRFKRGIVYYRLMAAASLFIALTFGILFLSDNTKETEGIVSQENPSEAIETPSTSIDEINPHITLTDSIEESEELESLLENDFRSIARENNSGSSPDGFEANELVTNNDQPVSQSVADNRNAAPTQSKLMEFAPDEQGYFQRSTVNLNFKSRQIVLSDTKPIEPYGYLLPPPRYVKLPKVKTSQLWAGLGVSTGNFDPNIGPSNSVNDAAPVFSEEFADNRFNALSESNEDFDPGISYSVALNTGWQFARKWILQGGLQYQLSRSSTQTNTLVENTATDEVFALTELNRDQALSDLENAEITSTSLNLQNNFQFISLPVKVGFIALDRQFQIGINTGISTDLFLRNKVSEANQIISDFEQSAGENSPYRRTFFSGIFGLSFGYKFLDNYALTIEPTYRRSLNSFTKQSLDVASNPSSLGITAGFRYIFK